MIRLRNFLSIVALLVGTAILAAPTQAQAGFAIQVYDDGSAIPSTINFSMVSGNTTTYYFSALDTHFSVTGSATVVAGVNGNLSVSYTDTVQVLQSVSNETLTLLATNTDYYLPTSSQVLLSASGGGQQNMAPGSTVAVSSLGFLDASNTQFGNGVGGTVAVSSGISPVSTNAQSTPITSSGTLAGVGATSNYTLNQADNTVASSTPFSLTNVSYFTFTAQAGDYANLSNSVSTVATPAPAGLVLILSGVPCLGVGAWLRRRRQTRVTAA
jgi:hypothetical protein